MSHRKTFRFGGLLFEGRQAVPAAGPIQNSFLPSRALVLLKQNEGGPARCVVRVGDYLREGAMVGKADAAGTAHVHAPVPGQVRDIRMLRVAAGGPFEAVEISLEGSFDRLGKREERYVWTSMQRSDILQTLRDKGVVEMEEPGRPLVDIVTPEKRPSALVLNCVETEPYVRTENAVFLERGAAVLEGFSILRQLLDPERSIIALSEAEEDSFAQKPTLLAGLGYAPEIYRLKDRFPQDMKNQLVFVIQQGKKRLEAETVFVVKPSTALAVYEAIVLAKPVIERYVTIGGGAIKHPAILKARIGTSIGDLVEECGGFVGHPERIVIGGPLRGRPVYNLDAPLTKQSSAVIALTAEECNRGRTTACIRCGRCALVCPERLLPAEIFRRLDNNLPDEALALGLERCTSCGACGYICPSRISLVEAFSTGMRSRSARP
jgi:electron transport complex protein RnfC